MINKSKYEHIFFNFYKKHENTETINTYKVIYLIYITHLLDDI